MMRLWPLHSTNSIIAEVEVGDYQDHRWLTPCAQSYRTDYYPGGEHLWALTCYILGKLSSKLPLDSGDLLAYLSHTPDQVENQGSVIPATAGSTAGNPEWLYVL